MLPPLLRENPNFRRFFLGQSVSMIGDQITTIALPARATIVEALHDFFAKSLRPGDRVLILTAGQSLTPLSAWTAEKKDIDAALDRASTGASQTMAGDRAQAERRLRDLINDIQQASGSQASFFSFDTLTTAVRNHKPGDRVELRWKRGAGDQSANVELGSTTSGGR